MLDTIVKDSMAAALEGEGVKEAVDIACKKAIESVISDAFGYNSDFRKQLKAKVEEVMPVVDVDDLAVFTSAVRQVVTASLTGLANEQAQKVVGGMLEELVPEGRVITVDDLESAFRAKISDYDEDPDSEYLEFLWELENSGVDGYFDLTCSEDENASRYSGKSTTLRFTKPDENGLSECYSATFGDINISKDQPFVGPLYGFDAMVFRLYTRTSKLKR